MRALRSMMERVAGTDFTEDGKYLAYGVSEAGSDWSHWKVMHVDSRKVLELPLIAGNVTVMANLSPGVLFEPTFPKDVRPFDTGSGSAIAGDGTRIGAAQFMLDGAMNNANTGFAYSPPPGVVQEVKVQTASFDASYGYMTGVAVNMSLKSGTNELHGQTYYFNQNPRFYANRFFLNRVGNNFAEHRRELKSVPTITRSND